MKKSIFVLSVACLLFSCTSTNTSSSIESKYSSSTSESGTSETTTQVTTQTTTSDNLTTSEQSNSSSESLTSSVASSSSESSSSSQDKEESPTNLYMIGDSTCANYDFTTSNTSYYYQIQGFGKTIKDYFNEDVNVVNLGVGGASSKSFAVLDKSIANYNTFKNNVKKGDYVIITFGHNDEKKTEVGTLVANDSIDTEGTFKYYLYNNFIKIAQEAGAIPILATPIPRYDQSGQYDVSSKYMHNMTEDSTFYAGNYAQEIRDLAEELSLTCIDTTNLMGDELRKLSAEEAKNWYGQPTSKTHDGTHVNAYGAQMVGYMMAKTLKESDNELGKYVVDNLEVPAKEKYLIVNSNYVEPSYIAPSDGDWSSNYPNSNGWHGSVFGTLKKNKPDFSKFSIKENSGDSTTGDLNVTLEDMDPAYSGRFNSTADGMVMYFQQISKNDSFTLEASIKIDNLADLETVKQNQNAVGIMVRDDMYIDEYVSGLNSRYAATGFYGTAFGSDSSGQAYSYCAWARRYDDTNTTEGKKDRVKENINPKVGTTIDVKIVKNDTSVTSYYKLATDAEYKLAQTFDTDLELTKVDSEYVYAGLFLCGGLGMSATFSNVKLEISHVE